MALAPTIRPAGPSDLGPVTALLRDAHLPWSDIAPHLGSFLVADGEDGLAGVVGLEARGPVGLLRSLAVAPAHRKRGLGRLLCQRMLAHARGLGVGDLYLLTLDAAGFFEGVGFRREDRAAVPPAIQSTQEFSALCPVSAVVMHLALG